MPGTTPVWPASLPQKPLADGFSEQPPDLVVRSQTDIGPAKTRRRATSGTTRLQVAFRFTPAQLATFRAFVAEDLKHRALSFTWAHPVTDAAGAFRIVDPPTYQPIAGGLAWRVALVLEQLP